MGLLTKAFSENRFHPSKWPPAGGNLERWLITGQSGGSNYTGKTVDEESALSTTAVWSAVLQLSQSVASLPLHFYKRLDKGKEKAKGDPRYRMLHLKPNPEMTSFVFREQQMGQVLRYGFCCSEKQLDNSGRTLALWPLQSNNVRMERFKDGPLKGSLYWIIQLSEGKQRILLNENMLHVPGFSSNGLNGYNPIKVNEETIALTLALEEYGARYFGNGARPDAVLEHPMSLSQPAQERIRKAWNEMHQGLENSHRIAILEEGMKLHEFSSNPQTAQANESRKFQIEEVARIFNIPVHMLKNLDKASFSNIEHEGLSFVINSLRPWLIRFEQAYNTQLLSDDEIDNYFFEHSVDGLLRGDTKTRHESYAIGRQWGYLSANDIREMENKNPIGPEGDSYLVPMNMIPADKVDEFIEGQNEKTKEKETGKSQGKEPEPEPEEEKSSQKEKIKQIGAVRTRISNVFTRLFIDHARKVVNREGIVIKKGIKKLKGEENSKRQLNDLTDFRQMLNDFYKDHRNYVKKQMEPVIRSYSEQMGFQVQSEINQNSTNLDNFISEYVEGYVERHINRSLSQINSILTQENPLPLIEERVDEWEESRPTRIAAEETDRCGNATAYHILSEANMPMVWRNTGTPCPFCSQLEGKSISKGGHFVQDGEELVDHNSSKTLVVKGLKRHPPLHTSTRCQNWLMSI